MTYLEVYKQTNEFKFMINKKQKKKRKKENEKEYDIALDSRIVKRK